MLYFRDSDLEIDTRQSDALKTTSLMVNGLRDFELGLAFRPYLGLGLGAARIKSRFSTGDTSDTEVVVIDDEVWTFAWQALVGITIPLSQRWSLGAEYRYWQAPSPDLEAEDGSAVDGRQVIQSGWLRLNYQPGGFAWRPAIVPRHPRPDGGDFYLTGSFGGGWATDRDLLGRSGQLDAFAHRPNGFGGVWLSPGPALATRAGSGQAQ